MMSRQPILQIKGLTLVSDRGPIVSNLSFDIHSGEIVALTGRSGSGKTSIALSILHLQPHGIQTASGTITWLGQTGIEMSLPQDANEWPPLRGSQIGYTQQDVYGNFDPVLTMGTQIVMTIRERINKSVEQIDLELRIKMEEVGLHDIPRLLGSYPHQLSGGQLQRCQIAMSIVICPQLLISDEPTSAIDKINQLELLDVFSMLRSKYNMAILCITHEEAVVRHLADREIQLELITGITVENLPKKKLDSDTSAIVLMEVNGLTYTHAYGGMRHKQGATVGALNMKLSQGKCLGIVGESGSGKSTLAQLLVGLYTPLNGQVTIEGRKIDFEKDEDIDFLRSKVQLVMQDGRGSLHPYMTIREILFEIGEQKKRVEAGYLYDLTASIHEVGLPDSVLDRTSGELSGGECLRVSIARALLMRPGILICDESTSALDSLTRDGIVNLLHKLQREKKLALIFISHDEHLIRAMADDIMVLANGQVVEQGSADAILKYPTHPISKRIFDQQATSGKRYPL